ncbi:hypothetical protein AAA799D11_01164 [Marine Group I thaumarchaeote SCGC AAA799-D11]|uniref:Uncharacterized protein n=1 Tax=Marine Group I thaumarchaeote SCGC AAA799-D11 TaxID=1502291 RepID=A0A087RQ05_9ARCH|nr:hypothetical protein AAA799D11_01164 [Marine Group I thaumarchaeote SCGC AAA799-D11]
MSGQTISKSLDYACDILLANNAVRYVGILGTHLKTLQYIKNDAMLMNPR